jgi:hypothetical protein
MVFRAAADDVTARKLLSVYLHSARAKGAQIFYKNLRAMSTGGETGGKETTWKTQA